MKVNTKKILVMGSGNGSNLEAIVKYFIGYDLKFTCISDNEDAYILNRARDLMITNYHVPFTLLDCFLEQHSFDLYVMAGYMRILPLKILNYGKFINIHPSLLPNYKGKDAIRRAFENNEPVTGVSVHIVTGEVDSGEILAQEELINDFSTIEELENAIHKIEHEIYPKVIKDLIYN